jgi:hypothetical protein
VGRVVGEYEGLVEGNETVGDREGEDVGILMVGAPVGSFDGNVVGATLGEYEGLAVGRTLGLNEGRTLGLNDGLTLGTVEGL